MKYVRKFNENLDNSGELETQYNVVKGELLKLQDLFVDKIDQMKNGGASRSDIRRIEENSLKKINEVLDIYFSDYSSEIEYGSKKGDAYMK